MWPFAAGAHGEHDEVGAGAVGDPQLLTGDDQVAAVDTRARLERSHIGAAAGFADAERGDHLAGDRRAAGIPLLFARAQLVQITGMVISACTISPMLTLPLSV